MATTKKNSLGASNAMVAAIKRISKVAGVHLEVGVLGPKARAKKDTRNEDGDIVKGKATVGEIAHVLHYGSSDGRIPARPFISITTDRVAPRLEKIMAAAVRSVDEERKTARQALGLVGEYIRSEIQTTISNGVPPANAESTIERKRSSTPLIDTGQLRSSVTYRVVSDEVDVEVPE